MGKVLPFFESVHNGFHALFAEASFEKNDAVDFFREHFMEEFKVVNPVGQHQRAAPRLISLYCIIGNSTVSLRGVDQAAVDIGNIGLRFIFFEFHLIALVYNDLVVEWALHGVFFVMRPVSDRSALHEDNRVVSVAPG